MGRLGGKFFEVIYEVGTGELLRTDHLPSNDSSFVDDVGFGKTEAAVKRVRGLILIEDGHQVDVVLQDVALVLREILSAIDCNYLNLWELVLEGHKTWHLLDAGSAPARPEVEDNDFAPKFGEIDGMLAVIESK